MGVSSQPNVSCTQPMMAAYAPSAQITCSRGSWSRTRCSSVLAPSRSWTSAGRTMRPQINPSVSTSRCRLRPLIFFPRVVALGPAGFRRLDALAVDDRRAGRVLSAIGAADVETEDGVDFLPDAFVTPGVEVVRHRLPRREVMGQHPPGATAAGQVADGVDDVAQGVGAWPSTLALALREEVLNVVPLQIGKITGITLPCIHGHKVNDLTAPREDQFLDGLSESTQTKPNCMKSEIKSGRQDGY